MAVAVKVGPWGASIGQHHDINPASNPVRLVSITIWSSEFMGGPICGFAFVYVDQHGDHIHVGPWGNPDPKHRIMNIEMNPGEYLYNLSGTANESAIFSLSLVTNQRTCSAGGPLEPTAAFSVPLVNGKVVAFFGRSDNKFLTALGIYVPVVQGSPVKVGPWGGPGGKTGDITTPVQLNSVTFANSNGRIDGFSFTYVDLTGQSIPVGPWGSMVNGQNVFTSRQGEYVNDISGTFDDARVTSLMLTTNQLDKGPFNYPSETFSVPLPDDRDDNGAVVGFFGRSGEDSLVALGVYVGLAPKP